MLLLGQQLNSGILPLKSLKTSIREYLQLRRSLGHKLEGTERDLKKFADFLADRSVAFITTKLALEWARLPKNSQPANWSRRLAIVRLFAQYHSAVDRRTEVPPRKLLAHKPRRAMPYIYSDEEIHRLVQACQHLRSRGLRHHTYFTFFGLMATTGCRISELIALNREDFNDKERIVKIHNSKFGKSRLLVLHGSTVRELKKYTATRDQFHRHPKTNSFFVSDSGTRLTRWSVRWAFIRVSKQIGLRKPSDSHGPRIHDIRHTFAVKTILRWYAEGVDVNQKIVLLTTYLGHKKPSDTYWYVTGVPELLCAAASRLESHLGE